jgi:hypothetical protein
MDAQATRNSGLIQPFVLRVRIANAWPFVGPMSTMKKVFAFCKGRV